MQRKPSRRGGLPVVMLDIDIVAVAEAPRHGVRRDRRRGRTPSLRKPSQHRGQDCHYDRRRQIIVTTIVNTPAKRTHPTESSPRCKSEAARLCRRTPTGWMCLPSTRVRVQPSSYRGAIVRKRTSCRLLILPLGNTAVGMRGNSNQTMG